MLKLAGWTYTGPKKGAPDWLKCWVNPRTGKSYTLEAATNIEELKESL
jgi:hypothetical protein